MKISKKEKSESARVAHLIKKVDAIDGVYVNEESDKIAQKHPFLISMLLGYRLDLKPTELEEMMRIIFLIWEYFKDLKQMGNSKITMAQFEKIKLRNITLLKYLEDEQSSEGMFTTVESDLDHLKSKALFTGVLFQMNHKKALLEMKSELKGNAVFRHAKFGGVF